ncbi:hypothetical protein F5Y13DRAFT_202719 [Hypoxylon sp. FL1857]|nr:hypothetical protein F5Y13DRAFT_202719 [Hypoxylon sp. FL1857]
MKVLVVGLLAALASAVAVPTESLRPPHWPTPTPTLSSLDTATSTTTSFIISITTLPGHPPAPSACPTVTHTTRPSECTPILCPVPGCTIQKELIVPCGCSGVKTALFVDGCQTACPEGCMTRLRTLTAACATQTPAPAPVS